MKAAVAAGSSDSFPDSTVGGRGIPDMAGPAGRGRRGNTDTLGNPATLGNPDSLGSLGSLGVYCSDLCCVCRSSLHCLVERPQ